MGKHIPPTKRLPDSGDPVGIASRKITAVDRPFGRSRSLHHYKKVSVREDGLQEPIPNQKTRRSVGGSFRYVPWVRSIFAFLCKNAPLPRGILKGPAPQSRSLKAVSFPIFLCRSKERLKKRNNRFHKTSSYVSKSKTNSLGKGHRGATIVRFPDSQQATPSSPPAPPCR